MKELLRQIDPSEEWTPIVGYEGHYEVSNLGRIRSVERRVKTTNSGVATTQLIRKKIFKPQPARQGYHQVCLCRNNHRHSYSICRLVAKAFIPNPLNKPQVNHKNSNRKDNRAENLEWVTALENMRHASIQGNLVKGEKNNKSKLNTDKVRLIRIIYPLMTFKELGKIFGVDASNIGYIVKGITWKHI